MTRITAAMIPYSKLEGTNNLQMQKKQTISNEQITNLKETTISFILQSTIIQMISETAYPIKVAMEAPSIPITGINVKFRITLMIAPNKRINIFGHVFLTTKN